MQTITEEDEDYLIYSIRDTEKDDDDVISISSSSVLSILSVNEVHQIPDSIPSTAPILPSVSSSFLESVSPPKKIITNAFSLMMEASKSSSTSTPLGSSSNRKSGTNNASTSGRVKKRVFQSNGGDGGGEEKEEEGIAAVQAVSSAPQKPPPFFKRVPGTDFLIDAFMFLSHRPTFSSNWFLTHFHSDHYAGLTKHFNNGRIYCSEVTRNLIVAKLKVPESSITILPLNQSIVIEGVKVTAVDACHCPGAVMLLFELPSGLVYLHTGDFRFNSSAMCSNPFFIKYARGANSLKRLDALYIDTTYAASHHVFPPAKAVVSAVCEFVLKKTSNGENKDSLILVGAYTIGKEPVYFSLGRAMKEKVCVDKSRLTTLSLMGFPKEDMAMLTTDKTSTRIHVVPLGFLTMKHLVQQLQKRLEKSKNGPSSTKKKDEEKELQYSSIIAVRPTGWTTNVTEKQGKKHKKMMKDQPSIASSFKGNGATLHVKKKNKASVTPSLADISISLGSSPSPDEVLPMFNDEPISQTREHRISKNLVVADIGEVPVSVQIRSIDRREKMSSIFDEAMPKSISIISVPYSEHSSFNELHECVKWFDPLKVIPTVNCRSSKEAIEMVELLKKGK
jgi:DNA repair metallo-beta-lactamase